MRNQISALARFSPWFWILKAEPSWRCSSCRKRHTMEGLLPTSVKVALLRQSCVHQPSRAQVVDFRHQTEPESLTNRSLEGVRRDGFATGPVPSNYAHGACACAERGASRCTDE